MYRVYVFLFALVLPGLGALSFSAMAATPGSETVAPTVPGVALESQGSLYWLSFDSDADALWPTLRNFWANEGIELKTEEPALGYMETRWIKDIGAAKWRSILLSDQAPERRERFRLRVERMADGGTRVFIHHSAYGILFDEEAVYSGYLPTRPELEIEMLSRLALYSGADSDVVEQKVAAYGVEAVTAEKTGSNAYAIQLPGSLDFVRRKLVRALDRMDVHTSTVDAHTLIARVTEVSTLDKANDDAEWEIDDDSDLEASGFDEDSKPLTKADKIHYRLMLDAGDSRVTVRLSSEPGNTDGGAGLRLFSQSLAGHLQPD
ncbi:MAG TPA: outer membrane protein assembly factor BamC [Thiotrichales bacterium]|nr:outer membrane protein assembly factor BamC [Thiotrichales bacterium]